MTKLGSMLALGALLVGAGPSFAATFTVTKTADTNDGMCNAGDCSLREAIIAANLSPGLDAVAVPAGTYVLTLSGSSEDAAATGDLDVLEDVTLTGAGAGTTVIDGNATDQVIHVLSGTVTVSAVTIRGGNPSGVTNDGGVVTLDAVDVRGNGAGVLGNAGTLSILNSALRGNGLLQDPAILFGGGGVVSLGGTLAIVNTTISGNAQMGVLAFSGLTMTNVTVAANTTTFGALFVISGGSLTNTLLANNTPSNCLLFGATSNGHNLDDDGSCVLTGPGDIGGVDAGVVFLSDNGGTTPTHALGGGSPALDAGDNGACPAADQRGVARPVSGTCDIGAFEGPPCFAAPDGASCDTDVTLCDGKIGTCASGVCSVVPGDPCPGTPCNTTCQESTASCFDPVSTPCADDGSPCTQDFCTAGSCTHPPAGAGTPCEDGIACNGVDKCLEGACFHAASCPGSGVVDHYQCWQAKDLNDPTRLPNIDDVSVSDQFASGTVDVKRPAFLCNPADQNGSGVINATAHICCYKAKGAKLDPPTQVEISDPFGTRHLQVRKPRLLCGPCTKTLLP